MKRLLWQVLTLAAFCAVFGGSDADAADYLKMVRDYADAMMEKGRDVYGAQHSPLFAEVLDRKTGRLLEGDPLQQVAGLPFDKWGIRPHDRMIGGANPQHCQNLYQILYALSTLTGQSRYAEAADESLQFFFTHCQSPTTGLLWWGEHAGWDFHTELPIQKPSGTTHEFYRPWVLWDRSWQLAPKPCRRFALGLWEHQIGNHETGDYSRHAAIDKHGPGSDAPYARHGGFYIETWATAYAKTGDKVFLGAIGSVVDGLERARLHEGGMLISRNKKTGARTPYDVSLAVSLALAAEQVPAELAAKLRAAAAATDKAFADAHGEQSAGVSQTPSGSGSKKAASSAALWSNAYGGGPPAGAANVWLLRYRQVPVAAYRAAALKTADAYRSQEINLSEPVWPGTLGGVILLMINAHAVTKDEQYLQAAERFAEQATKLFFTESSPLPKASHQHDHYEAVTNGDTLMMALLQLRQIRRRPDVRVQLLYCDR
ncbi:MAG TPA: hypothetical protein PLF81_17460 [Candidatus Anammoximicrobium sp.]|nr:hypothetical protein [Candidatus Anammoximicrobium sp.]